MCSISQTVRSSEKIGFNVGDPRGPSCFKALFDIYNDVGMSVFPKCLVQGPCKTLALSNTQTVVNNY